MAVFDREWRDGDRLVLRLPMEVTTSRWYENSVAVERGPLVYALAMRETWEKKPFGDGETAQFGDEYYEVTSADKWNYGILARAAEQPEKYFPYLWTRKNSRDAFSGIPKMHPSGYGSGRARSRLGRCITKWPGPCRTRFAQAPAPRRRSN